MEKDNCYFLSMSSIAFAVLDLTVYMLQMQSNNHKRHPAGTSVNTVNYGPCSKFCLVHYNVSQWEFQISHCFSSTIIFTKIFFMKTCTLAL